MIKGEFGGRKWRVRWIYPDGKGGSKTHCQLEVGYPNPISYFGTSRRNPVDQPDVELARRLSLDRALRGEDLDVPPLLGCKNDAEVKQFRGEVWGKYWGRRG